MKETKFKQTEVGMIPSDWEAKTLGSISFVTKLAGFEFTSHVRYSDDGKIIALRGLNVRKGQLLLDDVKYIDNSNFSKLNRSKLFKKDLLFTYVGTVGNAALVDKNNTYYLAPNVALIRIDEKNSPEYLMHLILSDYFFNNQIKTLMSTTSQAALSMTNIRLFLISLPPTIEEQQRIANALSDVDTLIANLEKLIAKKKNIKQGAMQQLLTGRKRLPGFGSDERTGSRPTDERRKECHSERSAKREVEESSGYKMTELGLIPNDWEVKTFGELFDMCTTNIPIKDVNQEFYVGTENMLQNKMGVVKNTAVLPYSKVREYQKNDILVSNIRPYLKKIWFADKNGGCSTDVLVFRVKDKNQSPSFLYNVVADDRFFNIVNENAIGTKMPRGDKNVIKQILFAVPSSKAEQTAIANVLSDMDTEISALETNLAKYRTLKTGMMQQLLTGKIRLV